jgi:hypothetical protein
MSVFMIDKTLDRVHAIFNENEGGGFDKAVLMVVGRAFRAMA